MSSKPADKPARAKAAGSLAPARSISNAKNKPDSLAQLAAVQFGARKKGIKTVLTSSASKTSRPAMADGSSRISSGQRKSRLPAAPASRHDKTVHSSHTKPHQPTPNELVAARYRGGIL